MLRESAINSSWTDEGYIVDRWRMIGVEPPIEEKFFSVPWDKSHEFERFFPELGRFLGAGIIEFMIKHPEGVKVTDSSSFAYSPDCEWAYALDLDSNRIEVYCRYEDYDIIEEESRIIDSDSGMKLILVGSLSNPSILPVLVQNHIDLLLV